MKRKNLILLLVITFSYVSVNAQKSIADKIVENGATNLTNKAAGTANTVVDKVTDKAAGTVNKAVDDLLSGNFFKKKNRKTVAVAVADTSNPAAPGLATTAIFIDNTDYNSIAALADMLKSNQEVKNVQPSFTNNAGTLTVSYTCTTQQVLDGLLKKTEGKYNVVEFSATRIVLKVKI